MIAIKLLGTVQHTSKNKNLVIASKSQAKLFSKAYTKNVTEIGKLNDRIGSIKNFYYLIKNKRGIKIGDREHIYCKK